MLIEYVLGILSRSKPSLDTIAIDIASRRLGWHCSSMVVLSIARREELVLSVRRHIDGIVFGVRESWTAPAGKDPKGGYSWYLGQKERETA